MGNFCPPNLWYEPVNPFLSLLWVMRWVSHSITETVLKKAAVKVHSSQNSKLSLDKPTGGTAYLLSTSFMKPNLSNEGLDPLQGFDCSLCPHWGDSLSFYLSW